MNIKSSHAVAFLSLLMSPWLSAANVPMAESPLPRETVPLTLADAVALLEGLGAHGRLRVLRSPYGHDAFLKETDRIDALLTTALQAPIPSGESA